MPDEMTLDDWDTPSPDMDLEMPVGLDHPLAQELLLEPSVWTLWPAVAVLRWLVRTNQQLGRGLVYRSHPTLAFSASEVKDVELRASSVDLVLSAPGLAAPGTILPNVDVARIATDANSPGGGALAAWLDGPGDRFMQAVEAAQMRFNAAFSLATGTEHALAHRMTAEIAGTTAPLAADAEGRLANGFAGPPQGALGLAAPFLGPPSAGGLTAAVEGYTGLPSRVEEFTGARVRVLRPAQFGAPLMRMLGRHCELPSAGVSVIVDGGTAPDGVALARKRSRRSALRNLCDAYIGSPSIHARLFVELEPEVIEPARLGVDEFGGLAVLGIPNERLRIPLVA